ncbi:MAG: glycosyltransferase family 4 protein [Pyrinomonadaceae bacterium]|nr:glycosyltransferase family 4 protein [Pyrinomonadaceae bacterium]
MNLLRVCFLCNEYPPGPHGGIGTMTQVLARALVQAGHEVRVAGMYPASYPAPDYEEDGGVRVRRLRRSAHRLGWVTARRQLFRMVARWSRDGEIDLVEVPDWEGWAAGWPKLPVPIVVRLHGSMSYFAAELGRPVRRTAFRLERASLRRADFWCSVSRYTADKTQQLFDLRTGPDAVLYNPVEFYNGGSVAAESRKHVVFTGTLTAKKGIVPLVKAWPRVIEACDEAELHVFGKDGRTDDGGSMQSFLLSQHNGRARESMRFHGHVDRAKLFEALRGARLAVFPSYAEAFALAPLEAMACGCPTIYSRRGSGPELIEDERDGLLIDPDQPCEIAEAIIRVLTDDHLARRLSEAGRERVRKNFSTQNLLEQNEVFYRRCIGDFRRKSAG